MEGLDCSTTLQTNFGNDADTVLGMLCSTYYELNCCQDAGEANQAFEELYQAVTDKALRKKDEAICAACRLSGQHQQTGFIDGIRLGLRMAQRLNK